MYVCVYACMHKVHKNKKMHDIPITDTAAYLELVLYICIAMTYLELVLYICIAMTYLELVLYICMYRDDLLGAGFVYMYVSR